tara:strand:- start:82 stop:243 length:162 start_codon:yes stop_codon:yes gene_type:complete
VAKVVTTTLITPKKIYRSKIEGVDPYIIQQMQQEWDNSCQIEKRKKEKNCVEN